MHMCQQWTQNLPISDITNTAGYVSIDINTEIYTLILICQKSNSFPSPELYL